MVRWFFCQDNKRVRRMEENSLSKNAFVEFSISAYQIIPLL